MNKYNMFVLETRGPLIQVPFNFLIENKMTIQEYLACHMISEGSSDLLNLYSNEVEYIQDVLNSCIDKGFLKIKSINKDEYNLEDLEMSKNLLLMFLNSNVTSWIDDWYDLWPSKIKSSGYYVKTDKQGCVRKLEKFRRKYPQYSAKLILKATKNYIDRMKLSNYGFMRLAPYFIEKDGISTLAGECEQILDELTTQNQPTEEKFGEKVYGT